MNSAAGVEARWAARVRANREQVDRFREVPDGTDFYAPVSNLFVDDPHRTGDAALDALLARARPDDTWLDIGAGAGRFALPLALAVREVIAVERSPSMIGALRAGMDEHRIRNVRIVEGAWPLSEGNAPNAEVVLIAHVGYDVEAIGAFLDAMEAAARRLCVAVLMDRSPSSAADPLWPAVHGEQRVPLPAMPELLDLLRARGRSPSITYVPRELRRWASEDDLLATMRHQLWVVPGGAKDRRLRRELGKLVRRVEDGVQLGSGPTRIGMVAWAPTRA